MILVNWFVGLVSAGFVRKFARVSDLFYFGPFIVVLLNVVLWASKGM